MFFVNPLGTQTQWTGERRPVPCSHKLNQIDSSGCSRIPMDVCIDLQKLSEDSLCCTIFDRFVFRSNVIHLKLERHGKTLLTCDQVPAYVYIHVYIH